jgi:hypothetical protein
MDAAEVSRLQILSTKSQKGLTADYADSTDEKQDSFIIRAIRVIRGPRTLVETLRFAWELELGISDFARESE